jgi:pyrophosphatase PpaX
MTSQIKTVVFDSDGTLMDGFQVIVDAYAHVAALHGRPAPTTDEVRMQLSLARPLHEIYQTLIPGVDVQQMIRQNGEFLAANFTRMPGFAGLAQMLESFHGLGLKLAILTGNNSKVHDLFRYHDIERYFTSIVHCDRVTRSKPDPEGFLLAMDECDSLASEAVMVGDSPNDIFAGKNAGARYTIGITHGHGSREHLKASDPDYIVGSLVELESLIKNLATN